MVDLNAHPWDKLPHSPLELVVLWVNPEDPDQPDKPEDPEHDEDLGDVHSVWELRQADVDDGEDEEDDLLVFLLCLDVWLTSSLNI